TATDNSEQRPPPRSEVIVAPSLHNVGGRSPIDLKIESQIPSKVQGPQTNKTSTRLSDGSFGGRARLCWTRASCRRICTTGPSRDAESAFWVMRMSQKRNAVFPFLEQPQPTRLQPNNFHLFEIQWLTTDISFVALRMHNLSA